MYIYIYIVGLGMRFGHSMKKVACRNNIGLFREDVQGLLKVT